MSITVILHPFKVHCRLITHRSLIPIDSRMHEGWWNVHFIDYFLPDDLERRPNESVEFRKKFLEKTKNKNGKILKNRMEKKSKLKENISLEAAKRVQN